MFIKRIQENYVGRSSRQYNTVVEHSTSIRVKWICYCLLVRCHQRKGKNLIFEKIWRMRVRILSAGLVLFFSSLTSHKSQIIFFFSLKILQTGLYKASWWYNDHFFWTEVDPNKIQNWDTRQLLVWSSLHWTIRLNSNPARDDPRETL